MELPETTESQILEYQNYKHLSDFEMEITEYLTVFYIRPLTNRAKVFLYKNFSTKYHKLLLGSRTEVEDMLLAYYDYWLTEKRKECNEVDNTKESYD